MEQTASSTDIRELNERIHQASAFIDLLMMELRYRLDPSRKRLSNQCQPRLVS